jgi:hypothetical protein
MIERKILEARLQLMEAQANLLLAEIRDLRVHLLPPDVPPDIDRLVCGHPREGSITLQTQDAPGTSLMCKMCGAVESRP